MTWNRSGPGQKAKSAYLMRYPERRRLTNKLSWLKRLYGADAVEYFLDHSSCEVCGEARFSCLAIHHPNGKEVSEHRTLCMNCHAIEHGGTWTLADCAGMTVRGRTI